MITRGIVIERKRETKRQGREGGKYYEDQSLLGDWGYVLLDRVDNTLSTRMPSVPRMVETYTRYLFVIFDYVYF